MVRLFILLAAAALVLLILALISALSVDRVRHAPRFVWVLLIVLLPIAGPIAYLLWGRPVSRRPARRPSSPDDDPDFLRSVETDSEKARRERELLAQLERELHQDDEKP